MTSVPPSARDHFRTSATNGVDELVALAVRALPAMQLPNGLFCYSQDLTSGRCSGESARYSIMVLLGAHRAERAGLPVGIDLDALHRRVGVGVTLQPGDVGLLLWAQARHGLDGAERTLDRLGRALADSRRVDRLTGMEVAWMVIGAAHAARAGLAAAGHLRQAADALDRRRSRRSPLYRHTASRWGRAALPNFATEIYTVLALSEAARAGVPVAAARAQALADLLIELRGDDGGWPWLFDSERGTVAEPFEVYSVHQDAMAPMALFTLAEVTGDTSYARAAHEGLPWLWGDNPLGVPLIDLDRGSVCRSIRRVRRARTGLAVNAALTRLGAERRIAGDELELNQTDRPYHLGWVLEAWTGRSPQLVSQGGHR